MKKIYLIIILVSPFSTKAQIGIGKIQIEHLLKDKNLIVEKIEIKKMGDFMEKIKIMESPIYKEAFFCTIENRIAKRRRIGFDFGVE